VFRLLAIAWCTFHFLLLQEFTMNEAINLVIDNW
jgi:hypothetical protein